MAKAPEKRERKIALVIVDAQLKFFAKPFKHSDESRRKHTPVINKAAKKFRAARRPVIFVMYDGFTHGIKKLDPDLERILPEIETAPTDIYVHKYHMNSFKNTNLEDIVKAAGCDSVLLAGDFTQYCVICTYYGAVDHDLTSFLLKGGTISTEEIYIDAAETVCNTFTMDEVDENLRTAKVVPRGNDQDEPRSVRSNLRCSQRNMATGTLTTSRSRRNPRTNRADNRTPPICAHAGPRIRRRRALIR